MTAQSDILNSLRIERRFSAPPDRVFRHWSDARLRQVWWGPAGFTCPALDSDFRPGGAWSSTIFAPDHGEYRMAGVYREIVPNQLIIFTFRWTSDPDPYETLVRVTLRPTASGGTLQSFEQGPFPTAADRDSHHSGWSECLDRQLATLEGEPK
jgi:uncharacterized protein YndB with AHSA1/START domain